MLLSTHLSENLTTLWRRYHNIQRKIVCIARTHIKALIRVVQETRTSINATPGQESYFRRGTWKDRFNPVIQNESTNTASVLWVVLSKKKQVNYVIDCVLLK